MKRREPPLQLRIARRRSSSRLLTVGSLAWASANLMAQIGDRDFLMGTAPYPVYRAPAASDYNLRWGRLKGKLHGGVKFEYNDNLNLAETKREDDWSIGPAVGVGFIWPISAANIMQIEIGLGYRWYLKHPELDSFNVSPGTRWDYRIFFEKGQINIYDHLSVTVDPTSRPELDGSNTGGGLLNFQVLHNVAGIQADWQPFKNWGFTGCYSYGITRSLTAQFELLDRDDHTFTVGTHYTVTPRWTVGASASAMYSHYLKSIQNDGTSYTFGPYTSYRMTRFISLDASLGYSVSVFDDNGTIGDTSDFGGFTFQVGMQHRMNNRMTQSLRAGKAASLGLGSNFTDTWNIQHGISYRLSSKISLNSTTAYEHSLVSGTGGETSDRLLWYLGTNYQFAKHWTVGLAYAMSVKDSNQSGRDYYQNRFTVDLTRQF